MDSHQTNTILLNSIQAEKTVKNPTSSIMEQGDNIEYEPFDSEKEKYIDQDLMDKFDFHVVTTTRLRKTGPAQVKSKLKKIFRLELRHICKAHFESVNSEDKLKEELHGHDNCLDQNALEERLRDTNDKCEELKTNCAQMLSKTRELVKSVEMYKKFSKTDLHQVLNETPPTTPDTMDTGSSCFSETHLNKCINRKLNV